DILCEGCGYMLNTLPETGNCPECGKPISKSSPTLRAPPKWEVTGQGFIATTLDVLFRPSQFYRKISTREGNLIRAARFSSWHFLMVSIALAASACGHLDWLLGLSVGRPLANGDLIVLSIGVLVGSLLTFGI